MLDVLRRLMTSVSKILVAAQPRIETRASIYTSTLH